MFTDTHDQVISPHMWNEGFWEAWISLLFLRSIKPGDVCLDVGANQGYFSLLMAAQVGPKGYVGAVEPIEKLCRLIERSAVANEFSWLHAFNYAASDATGHIDLWIPPQHEAYSSLIKPTADAVATRVPMTRLDELFDSLDHVDFVKIDAEFAEPQIVEGMRGLIERSPNIRICLEWAPNRYDDPMSILKRWKKDFRIDLCNFDGFAERIRLRPLTKIEDLVMILLTKK